MLPSVFRVYLLSKTSVSVELTDTCTARDVCLQIKRRLSVQHDADYGLFGACRDCSWRHATQGGSNMPMQTSFGGVVVASVCRGAAPR